MFAWTRKLSVCPIKSNFSTLLECMLPCSKFVYKVLHSRRQYNTLHCSRQSCIIETSAVWPGGGLSIPLRDAPMLTAAR
jgi:hypothetical protein